MAKWSDKPVGAMGSEAAQPLGSVSRSANAACLYCGAREGELHNRACVVGMGRYQGVAPLKTDGDFFCPACNYVGTHGKDCPIDTCPEHADPDDEDWVKVTVRNGYNDLFVVLQQALWQAQDGKGSERHGNGQPFTEQPALTITRAVGIGFPLGQAMKKIQESQRMDTDAAKRELLGAINYLAAAILFLDD